MACHNYNVNSVSFFAVDAYVCIFVFQVTALQDEKNSLVSENEMMNEKLDQLDGSFDDPNTMVAKKYFHAQLQLEQLQEENFRQHFQ